MYHRLLQRSTPKSGPHAVILQSQTQSYNEGGLYDDGTCVYNRLLQRSTPKSGLHVVNIRHNSAVRHNSVVRHSSTNETGGMNMELVCTHIFYQQPSKGNGR